MPRKILFMGLVVTALVLLAQSSREHGTATELRPQAIQQLREEIAPPRPAAQDQLNNNTGAISDQLPPVSDNQPAVAGASHQTPDPAVKQTITQDVADDSVKVNIEQQIDSAKPVNNKIKVKVDTGQDPPLVEISAEPKPISCAQDTFDCADFSTCADAQAVYGACAADIHRLDPDNNGLPCDSLCAPN